MKILHIGGVPAVVGPLANFQRSQDHAVTTHLPRSCGALEPGLEGLPDLARLLAEGAQLLHFHQLRGLAQLSVGLQALRAAGAKLVLELAAPLSAKNLEYCVQNTALLNCFDRVLSSDPELLARLEGLPNFQWSAPGLPLESIPKIEPYQPELQKVKILHLALPDFEADTAVIMQTIAALKAKGLRFLFAAVPVEEVPDIATLCLRFSECDLLIEAVSQSVFGLAGAYAMACGKTVLGGNRPAARARWTQLETSPVIDVMSENLTQKLEAVLREPRSMRDLGKRGRAYAEKHLDVRRTAALIYQAL